MGSVEDRLQRAADAIARLIEQLRKSDNAT